MTNRPWRLLWPFPPGTVLTERHPGSGASQEGQGHVLCTHCQRRKVPIPLPLANVVWHSYPHRITESS